MDGGKHLPDTLTVLRASAESGTPIASVVDYDSRRELLILDRAVPREAVREGDILAIATADGAYLAEAGPLPSGPADFLTLKKGGRFTNTSSPVIPQEVDAPGASVHNFRDVTFVTYYVDMVTERLMADYHDVGRAYYDDKDRKSSVVANHIEDLQLYYFFETDKVDPALNSADPVISSNRLNRDRVKAVSVGLVSRSPYGKGKPVITRPALFNRLEGTARDNRPRDVLVETVFVRNYQR